MKNIINQKPDEKLSGRLKYTTEFVDAKDIRHKKVLDLGCGYGWFINYCIINKASEILGAEVSEEDLATSKKYIKNKKVKFSINGALKLPFPDESFDTVVAWEVIEHIPEKTENKMFKEVQRVLKKDGIFYLSTPNASFISKYTDPAYYIVGHRHYNLMDLINIGISNNFYLCKMNLAGGFWSTIYVLNMYFSKWILRREPIFNTYLSRMDTKDYKKGGFYNIFIKFKKI